MGQGAHRCFRLDWAESFLAYHPVGGGFLGLPGLKKLFGQLPQLGGIAGGIQSPIELLQLEVLFGAEFDS